MVITLLERQQQWGQQQEQHLLPIPSYYTTATVNTILRTP